jgi:hypothetical protein
MCITGKTDRIYYGNKKDGVGAAGTLEFVILKDKGKKHGYFLV